MELTIFEINYLQLMYVPTDYNKTGVDRPLKKIMVPHGMPEAKVGPDIFLQHRCPVNTCTIVRDNAEDADLILFKDYITHVGRRSASQVRNSNFVLSLLKVICKVTTTSKVTYGEIVVSII